MANGNDTRIVEMQFENKRFDKNIAKSQKSLARFKKELNFEDTSKGFDEFSKSMAKLEGFDVMADNIQKLTDKFTGLGTVSEFVLSRIRRSLEAMGDKVINFANSMTTVQAQAGFTKYETLNKAVQTIKAATNKEEKEVYGVLDRLNKYTDETSYDFAEMVSSIGKFTSAGIELEKAEKAMEGIANWAALSGAGIQEANRAMYNLSQSMGQGHLTMIDWRSIENANMATKEFKEEIIAAGVAEGKLTKKGDKFYAKAKKGGKEVEVTWKNFRETLQTGWVTNSVMMRTLEKYADTTTELGNKAYAAAQRCLTFSHALNAWKDMLSTGWMQTYRTVFGDLSDAMNLFSGICNKVSDSLTELSSTRNRILKSWKGFGGRDSLWSMLVGEIESPDAGILFENKKGILDIFTATGEMIQNAFWAMVKDSMNEADRAQLEFWAGNSEAIMNLLDKQGMLDGASEEELEKLREYIEESFGERGLLIGYMGGKLAEATDEVHKFVGSVFEWLNTTDSKGVTRLEKFQNVLEAVFNTLRFFGNVFGDVFDFISDVVGQLAPSFDSVIDLLSELGIVTKDAENRIVGSGKISAFLQNLAEAIKPITDLINSVVGRIAAFFTQLLHGSEKTEEGGEKAERAAKRWQKVTDFFQGLADILSSVIDPVLEGIKEIFDALGIGGKKAEKASKDGSKSISFFEELLDVLRPILGMIGKIAGSMAKMIASFINWGRESGAFAAIWEKIKSVIKLACDSIEKALGPIGDFVAKIGDLIRDLFQNGLNAKSLQGAWDGIKSAFTDLIGQMTSLLPDFSNGFGGFFDSLINVFTKEEKKAVKSNKFKIDPSMLIASTGVSDVGAVAKKTKKELLPLEKIGELFGGISGNISEYIGKMIGSLGKLIENFNLGTMTKMLAGAWTISWIVKRFVGIGKNISRITDGLNYNVGKNMILLSTAIAILTGCIYMLSDLDVNASSEAISIMMKVMWGMNGLFAAMGVYLLGAGIGDIGEGLKRLAKGITVGKRNIDSFGTTLLKIATSLLISAYAFEKALPTIEYVAKKLQKLKWGEESGYILERICAGFLVGVAAMVLIGKSYQKVPPNTFLGLAAFVAAIIVLIFTLKSLVAMKPLELTKMGISFLVLLFGFARMARRIGKNGTFKDKGLESLIWFALSLFILIKALKPLAKMEWEELGKMGAGFAVMIAGFSVFFRSMPILTKQSKGTSQKTASVIAALIPLAFAMRNVIKALKPLAGMEWKELGKMGAGFAVLIAGLSLAVSAMQRNAGGFGKGLGIALTIAAFALTLRTIVSSIRSLGEMSPFKAKRAGTTLAILVVALSSAIKQMQKHAKNFSSSLGTVLVITSLCAALTYLMLAVHPLSQLGGVDLSRFLRTFLTLVLGLGIAVRQMQKSAANLEQSIGAVTIIAAVAYAIGSLVYVLGPLGKASFGELIKMTIGFKMFIQTLTLSVTTLLKQKTTSFKDAVRILFSMGEIVGAMWALIRVLSPLAGVSLLGIIKMCQGFKSLIKTLFESAEEVMTSKITRGVGKRMAINLAAMAGVTGNMWLLIRSLQPLASLSLSGFVKMLSGFKSLVKRLLEATETLAKIKHSRIKSSFASLGVMTGITGNIFLLVQALKPMASVSILGMAKMCFGLKTLLKNLLNATSTLVGIKNSNIKKSFGTLGVMAGIVGSIWLLVTALKPLANISLLGLGKMGAGLAGMIYGLTFATKALVEMAKDANKLNNKGILKVIGVLASVVLGIAAMVGVMLLIPDNLGWDKFLAYSVGMAAMALGLSYATKALIEAANSAEDMSWKGFLKALGMMVLVVAAIAGLTWTMTLIKDVDWKTIGAFTIGFGVMMLALAGALKVASSINLKAGLGGILILVGGLAGIIAVIGGLGSWALSALSETLPAFANGLKNLSEAVGSFGDNSAKVDPEKMTACVDLLEGIALVQAVLTTKDIAVGVFEKLTGVGLEQTSMEEFGQDIVTIGKFLAQFAKDVGGVSFDNVTPAVNALNAMAVVKSKLTFNDIVLTVFKKLTGIDLDAGRLTSFASDIVAVAPMLQQIGTDLKDTDFTNFEKAAQALEAFGGIRAALSLENIAFTVFEKLTGTKIEPGNVSAYAENIATVAPILQSMGETLKETDFDNFEKASAALQAFGGIRAGLTIENIALSVFEGITGKKIDAGNVKTYAENISEVAPILQNMGSTLKETDFTNFDKASAALQAFGGIRAGLTIESIALSVFEGITGKKINAGNLETYAENILAAAPILQKIGTELKEADFSNFESAATALTAFWDIRSALTWEDLKLTLFESLTGKKVDPGNIATFADNILAAAPAIQQIGTELKGADFSNFGEAAKALNAFSGLETQLTGNSIHLAWTKHFLGDIEVQDLKTFGEKLPALGGALASFADSVNVVTDSEGKEVASTIRDFGPAIDALGSLVELQEQLPVIGGVVGWFNGDQMNFSQFAVNITDLGRGLAQFSDALGGFELDGNKVDAFEFDRVKSALESLGNLTGIMMNISNVPESKLLSGLSYAAILAEFAQDLTDDISDLSRGAESYGPVVDNIVGFMQAISWAVADAGDIDANALDLFKTATEGLQTLVEASIGNDGKDFSFIGAKIPKGIATGISDGKDAIITAIRTLFTSASNTARYDYSSFNTVVGYNIASGIAKGIKSGQGLVTEAVRSVVDAAKVAAMDQADEASPSKLFAMIGGYMSEGMAIGITEKQSRVIDATTNLTDSAIEGASDAMAIFASLMSQEIDANPTITPVLDLSNVKNGASYINGVLGGEQKYNLSAGTAGNYAKDAVPRSGRSSGEYQGTDLTGINTRISELGNRITALGNQMSNLQIVLDSGELVGSISGGVSSKIGRKSSYNRRRNA